LILSKSKNIIINKESGFIKTGLFYLTQNSLTIWNRKVMICEITKENKRREEIKLEQNEMLGQKVNVWFPHYCKKIQRKLKEDSNGLYVSYQNQRCSVRPNRNCLDEVIKDYYVGIHPKLARMLNNE